MAARFLLSECGLSLAASSRLEMGRLSSREDICNKGGRNQQKRPAPRRKFELTGCPAYISLTQRISRPTLRIQGRATDKKNKIAKLYVTQRKTLPLPTFIDREGTPQHLRVFLSEPEGRQSMLNTKALEKYEDLGDNKFRCYLPKIEFLNFEVAPVVDLLVAASEDDCQVELLSCKVSWFEGSDLVRSQNERFSASLKNHLRWSSQQNQEFLDVNLELNVALEVYTLPFTLLPVSAVETPGNLRLRRYDWLLASNYHIIYQTMTVITEIMQSLVDRLLPLFLDNMFKDYQAWAKAYPNSRS